MAANIVLTVKQKQLIGVGASVAAGCQPCTLAFADAARKAGACDRGVRAAIEAGLAAREGASSAMAAFAAEKLPHPVVDEAFRAERITLDALIAVAAAISGNTASRVQAAVEDARRLGATDDQIALAADVARTAKRGAERETDAALDVALGKPTQPSGCAEGRTGATAPASGCGCGCKAQPEFEAVQIEKTEKGCSLCEEYAEQQAAKPVVVMSCEGACLRGEISRQAANHLCHVLAPEKTARLCLGGAFTKDAGQRALVRNARRVVSLEGCPIRCASRMMRGHFPDLDAEVVITEGLCDFDRSLFGTDALPPEEMQALGRTVALKVASRLQRDA